MATTISQGRETPTWHAMERKPATAVDGRVILTIKFILPKFFYVSYAVETILDGKRGGGNEKKSKILINENLSSNNNNEKPSMPLENH